jgi:putative transposase
MKFQFIHEHRPIWPISLMCRLLGVSRSGYYSWRRRPASARKMADKALTVAIKSVHQASRGVYGSLRVFWRLRQLDWRWSRKRVARLMRQLGLRGKRKRRFRPRTTNSDHGLPSAPNRLNQDFAAAAPNRKWVSDISYIDTAEGWLYLAVIIDLYSRKVVGWAMSHRIDRFLGLTALDMATRSRKPAPGLIFHSDRGSQYASADFQNTLAAHGMVASMSGKGNCYDNAPAESWFASLKVECVDGVRYKSRKEARSCLFDYIERFYNRQRLHSYLGYLSPLAYEQQYAQLPNVA